MLLTIWCTGVGEVVRAYIRDQEKEDHRVEQLK